MNLLAAVLIALIQTANGRPSAAWPEIASEPRGGAGNGESDAALVIAIEDYLLVEDVEGAGQNAADWYRWLARTRGVPLSRIHRLNDAELGTA